METNKRRASERLMGDMLCADSVVLRGDRGVTAYGCRRILHYAADRICLSLGKRKLSVTGEGLICLSFSAGTVAMEGRVCGVHYCADVCEKCPFCVRSEEDA
ncbi:MAG: YabP/YqfC family sporulation protein [Clostridia bacterium]|nr:YabP/YqfC family sporulation protein [Clostridia bacterium]MBQ9774207.1 YabP/YqfC family sporulation protein [Clostridia bacterium]